MDNKKYDIHLSAYEISKAAIKDFETLGFQRDEFANNTRCEVTAYHGTYRGKEHLPNTDLWDSLCKILNEDVTFSGGLEEEEFKSDGTIFFTGEGQEVKPLLPALETEQPAPNIYKACDIHINIDVENSDSGCLEYLEALQVASFDKPKDGKVHRIYTITTDTLENGFKAFSIISEYLKDIKGLKGKMKLEKTTRFLRKPATAYTLPLTNQKSFENWLHKLENSYAQ
jgi:hypothetical protein